MSSGGNGSSSYAALNLNNWRDIAYGPRPEMQGARSEQRCLACTNSERSLGCDLRSVARDRCERRPYLHRVTCRMNGWVPHALQKLVKLESAIANHDFGDYSCMPWKLVARPAF